MIEDIVRVTVPGFALGAAVMAAANRRASPEVARERWIKLAVYFLIVHAVLAAAAGGRLWIVALLVVVLAVGTVEFHAAWKRIPVPRPAWLWPSYFAVAALAVLNGWRLLPEAFAFVYVVTAGCDGFSQVVGQWLGRRPLAPHISPRKTVGGLMGGLIAALVVAVLVRDLIDAGPIVAACIGVLTGLAGLAGDLSASWVKRRAGLKDYSAALPGQGGFLDRFDSLLGALVIVGSLLLATLVE